MERQHSEPDSTAGRQVQRPVWQRGWFKLLAVAILAVGGGLVIAAEYLVHHAEPVIRKRIIETLSASFNSSVELDSVRVSLVNGIQVSGDGLRVPYGTVPQGANTSRVGKPIISVRHFAFRTTIRGLLRQPTHVSAVSVEGMELHIPPAQQRGALLGAKEGRLPADPSHPRTRPKIAFTVARVECRDVKLFIETNKPGKEPLEFDIDRLNLQHVGPSRAAQFEAELMNPKPRGLIQTRGHFGPWNSEGPRQTPVNGDFTFTDADMNTINGLGGTLQGQGRYDGVLDHLVVDGTADVPNFSLDTANHPMPLRTRYHAFVDGTTGDTTLDPVQAVLGHSGFTAKGKVVKITGAGHDIDLTVSMPKGRIEDTLQLAMKTEPPVMRGAVHMEARLHIPPGEMRVPLKMSLAGKLQIMGVAFGNPHVQDKVDGLSMRAQGKPQDVQKASTDRETEVHSQMAVDFALAHGTMIVSSLHYEVPGANVTLDGVYSLDGNVFEFKGHVRTRATASQMVAGWKSWLLKPVDPFLKKHGAGVELPVSISGTQGDVHMGLALGGADETPAQMKGDLKERAEEDSERGIAKRAAQKADREDAMAAKARDLKTAERLHNEAVGDRREAQRHLAAAGPSR